MRGQTVGHSVEESQHFGQGPNHHEGDHLGERVESGDQRTRFDRILGQQDHVLRRRSGLSQGLLLDIQVSRVYYHMLLAVSTYYVFETVC